MGVKGNTFVKILLYQGSKEKTLASANDAYFQLKSFLISLS